jgi:hypothetical protein
VNVLHQPRGGSIQHNEYVTGVEGQPARPRGVRVRVKRVALVCAMSLSTINIWTGGPLLALWVGSRVQSGGPPSMAAVGVVALVLGAVGVGLVRVLAVLDDAYDRLTGRGSQVRRHVPWLRSMRGERPHEYRRARDLSPLEVILIVSVVVAVVAFEIWFFFFSGSPIDQRSGRG